MATPDDFPAQSEHLKLLKERELLARWKAYDMHGGDNPGPNEQPMPTIITQCGEWAVTPFGVECLVYPYTIQWDSILDPVVDDDYWLRTMAQKEWVKLEDFAAALHHGRKIHRYLQGVGDNNTTRELI